MDYIRKLFMAKRSVVEPVPVTWSDRASDFTVLCFEDGKTKFSCRKCDHIRFNDNSVINHFWFKDPSGEDAVFVHQMTGPEVKLGTSQRGL